MEVQELFPLRAFKTIERALKNIDSETDVETLFRELGYTPTRIRFEVIWEDVIRISVEVEELKHKNQFIVIEWDCVKDKLDKLAIFTGNFNKWGV